MPLMRALKTAPLIRRVKYVFNGVGFILLAIVCFSIGEAKASDAFILEFAGESVLESSGIYAAAADEEFEDTSDAEDALRMSVVEPPQPPPKRGRIVIFASERIGRDWIGSYFNTLPEGSPAYNQCELSLSDSLTSMGFENGDGKFNRSQRAKAKGLRTVFQRYRDMSTMANDTAVRASEIVDSKAHSVILCNVDVGARRGWRKRRYKSCAEVRCKAISTDSLRRLATHSIDRCAGGPEEVGASVEAIKAVCSEAGRGIGEKIVEIEGKGL